MEPFPLSKTKVDDRKVPTKGEKFLWCVVAASFVIEQRFV
jgi:hypothetical protein